MKKAIFATRQLVVATGLAVAAMAAAPVASADLSGNIGVFSKYVLRGNTNLPENSGTAVQGGFDWTSASGFFLGYWGSNLDYTYDETGVGYGGTGFENDFYGGYAGKIGDLMSYSVGVTQYYYINVDDSNLVEPFVTFGVGPVTLGAKYLAKDGFWGNAGDTYVTLTYATDLPKEFKFSATAGFYFYETDDSKELCKGLGFAGEGCGATLTDSDFRHVDLTLSHPIGKSGAEMAVTYIAGGTDRFDVDLEETVVLSVKYPFGI